MPITAAVKCTTLLLFMACHSIVADEIGVWGDNRRLVAFPNSAAQPVTIDGRLDDWDMETAIFVTENPRVAERQHAWLAVRYDADAFYLGVRVRDDSPMNNLHGPEGSAKWAWNADSLQFRLFLDPALGPSVFRDKTADFPIAHLLMWNFSIENKPCLQLSKGAGIKPYDGRTGVVPDSDFDAAYRKWPDGPSTGSGQAKGYSFEYRIPWSLLGLDNAPAANAVVPATFQIQYDDGSGLRSPRRFASTDLLSTYAPNQWRQYESWGRLIFAPPDREIPATFYRIQMTPEEPQPLELRYTLPRTGRVSLHIRNSGGDIVRRLLADVERSAGDIVEHWNGCDDAGKRLPPGDYTVEGIIHDPITLEYRVGVNNAGNPTWHTTDGKGTWGGDHGLAYGGDTLYASYAKKNRIVAFDGATGRVKNRIVFEAPGPLTVLPDGRLLVSSGDAVWHVDATGERTPFLRGEHVEDPRGLAVADDGRLYLANGGALQNVSVFDADGAYIESIGEPGGRPLVGRHNPAAMLEPWTLAFDDDGQLWVTEHIDRPKRISVWDVETGENVDEFFGVARFSNFACIDPENPEEVFSADATLWTVDLDSGNKAFHSTLYRQTQDDMPGDFGNFRLIRARNGRQYIYPNRSKPKGIFIREGDVLRPVFDLLPGQNKAWQDHNRDGRYQENEFSELTVDVGRHIQCVDRDLNIWLSGHVFRPTEIAPDGQPLYDFSAPEKTPIRCGGPVPRLMSDPDEDGTFYVVRPGGREKGEMHPGTIDKMTADGKVLWRYPNVIAWRDAWNLGYAPPGHIYGPWGILGMKGDFLAIGTFRASCHVFTRDGFYVTELLPEIRSMRFESTTIKQELHGGTLAPWRDGSYLLACGDSDARLLEVRGLDTIERFQKNLEIPADTHAVLKSALDAYYARSSASMPLIIARGEISLRDVPMRGEPPAQKIERVVDEERRFAARAAWTEEDLLLRFDIQSPAPFISNVALDSLQTGGNVIDLRLQPKKGARTRRLIVTQDAEGKAKAALYGGGKLIDVSDRITLATTGHGERHQVRVKVPLGLLDWQPQPLTPVNVNLGYRFGNADGSRCIAPAYWQGTPKKAKPTPMGTAWVE